jgi:hypothetical protein
MAEGRGVAVLVTGDVEESYVGGSGELAAGFAVAVTR